MTFKRTTLEETLAVSPLLVLDGAMSTPLENMGIDLNTKLWTAKVLADQPEMVKQVHKNYFKAGADCGITCREKSGGRKKEKKQAIPGRCAWQV